MFTIAEEWTIINVNPLNIVQTAYILVGEFEVFRFWEVWAGGWHALGAGSHR
jgi:hypothetical protein